ncbi:MAG: nucleotidyl transferase AbiEii/AbiGii toxin family protein [Nitrospirota bacterium]
MSNILFDLSGKIDQQTVETLSIVKRVADSLRIPFFVVGASARDFILEHCYGIKPRRMTKDIDLGVEVSDWEQFNQLKASLIATSKFSSDEKEPQRLHCDSVIVDIVLFGPITDENRRISWPPEHEIFMSMLGFKEAYEYSITIKLSSDPEINIKLATLPGLALMKIISWKEKYPERKRDAEDLLLIMQKYEDAGNSDRLYREEQGLLQEENFDTRLASIRLLGRDMAKIADPDTFRMVKTILDSETGEQSQYRLVTDMIRSTLMFDENFEQILLQLEKLRKGLEEIISAT